MLLGEALILRSQLENAKKRSLDAVCENVRTPPNIVPEHPAEEILKRYTNELLELENLIFRINQTNARTIMKSGITLDDALARRDQLRELQNGLRQVAQDSRPPKLCGKDDVRWVVHISSKSLEGRADRVSRELRLLEVEIQQSNWTVDLVDQA